MVSPSALAVLRLMTNSNLAGCKTGEFGELGAFENAPGIDTRLVSRVGKAGPVAEQPARRDVLASRIDRRDRVARRQRGELGSAALEEGVVDGEERLDPLLGKGCECSVVLRCVPASTTWTCFPIAAAASCSSRTCRSDSG